MAGAMVRGLLRSNACQPADIAVLGGAGVSASNLAKETGVRLATSPADLLAGADAVVVACKPQQFLGLDAAFAAQAQGKLILSVLAGTRLATLGGFFAGARNLARAMPNTPGAVGQGITAQCSAQPLSAGDAALIASILSGLGQTIDLPEDMFNAVTAVSGSGPGFFFEYVAAYEEAAKLDPLVIAEKGVLGGEYTVGIIGDEAMPIIKIEPATEWYDYEAKYNRDDTQYLCPCGLPEAKEMEIRQGALEAFRVLGGRGWGRVDFLMDEDGKHYFLEVNTAPGMTDHSLVPMAARVSGLDYPALVRRVLELAAND